MGRGGLAWRGQKKKKVRILTDELDWVRAGWGVVGSRDERKEKINFEVSGWNNWVDHR